MWPCAENVVRQPDRGRPAAQPAGTDTFVPGHSLHDELALLVRAGLTPLDALHAATTAPARFLGVADRFGAIAPGMAADLVLLDANPLDDIASTRAIRSVIVGGKIF